MENLTQVFPRPASAHAYGLFILKQGVYFVWGFVIVMGTCFNIINIRVFFKTAVKDNVTTTLVFLSVSDLLFLVMIAPNTAILGLKHFLPDYVYSLSFDFNILNVLPYWYSFLFYDISICINAFLALMKCACVSMPLRFKNTFTRQRTIVIICCLIVINTATHIPLLQAHSIGSRFNPVINTSFYYLIRESNTPKLTEVNDIVNRNLIPITAFIVVVICFLVMAWKLYQASKFRQSSSSASGTNSSKPDETKDKLNSESKGAPSHKMSSRDTRLLKSVMLVAVIFILCQIPTLGFTIARHLDSEFTIIPTAKKHNLFVIATYVSKLSSLVNATVNIFVYYNYNSKFKSCFNDFLHKSKK